MNGRDAGFTVIELLVSIVIIGVIGAAVLTSVVQGLQVSASTAERVDTLSGLQQVHERMSRQIRAANPLVFASHTELTVQVDAQVQEGVPQTSSTLTYRMTDATVELITATDGQPLRTETILDGVPVESEPFRYFDASGNEVLPPIEGLLGPAAASVVQVRITLQSRPSPDGPPIALTTGVQLRNTGVAS